MRRPQSLTGYTVEVSPAAWGQLAQLPLATYERIRTELDTLAAKMRAATPAPLPLEETRPAPPRAIVLEEYVARYDVDREHKRLTLLEVARRSSQSS